MSDTAQHTDGTRTYYPFLGVGAVLLGAALATFLGRLLSVGAGDLRGALGLDYDAASWISTTYNMGLMFVGPFSVFLGAILGPRRVLLACAVGFTVLCAFAPFVSSFPALLTILALAGLTAGTFYPLTLSFILRNIPQQYAVYGIGVYAFDIVVTTHLAHSWEGWLIRVLSWRWIFWTVAVFAPVMILFVLFGIKPQPLPTPAPGQPKPSWRGFFYASSGAALLYGAMDQGERMDWWRSSTFVAMVVTGVFLILCALVRHFSKPNPLINYSYVRRRNVILLAFVLIFFRFVLLSAVVVVPSYLTSTQGYIAEQVGPVLLWLAVPEILAGFLAVYLLERIDPRLVLGSGFALMGLACLMNAGLSSDWSGNNFQLTQLILSLGEGLAFNGLVGTIILEIINSGAKGLDLLTFSGFFQTIRLLGGELGATFIGFFLQHREEFHSNMIGQYVQNGSTETAQRIQGLTAGMHANAVGPNQASGRAFELLGLTVRKQAFTLAITDSFLLLAFACVICLLVVATMSSHKLQFKALLASLKGQKA